MNKLCALVMAGWFFASLAQPAHAKETGPRFERRQMAHKLNQAGVRKADGTRFSTRDIRLGLPEYRNVRAQVIHVAEALGPAQRRQLGQPHGVFLGVVGRPQVLAFLENLLPLGTRAGATLPSSVGATGTWSRYIPSHVLKGSGTIALYKSIGSPASAEMLARQLRAYLKKIGSSASVLVIPRPSFVAPTTAEGLNGDGFRMQDGKGFLDSDLITPARPR